MKAILARRKCCTLKGRGIDKMHKLHTVIKIWQIQRLKQQFATCKVQDIVQFLEQQPCGRGGLLTYDKFLPHASLSGVQFFIPPKLLPTRDVFWQNCSNGAFLLNQHRDGTLCNIDIAFPISHIAIEGLVFFDPEEATLLCPETFRHFYTILLAVAHFPEIVLYPVLSKSCTKDLGFLGLPLLVRKAPVTYLPT